MPRIAIIGLGLIGGSLGLALKRAELPNLEIAGHDRERGVASRAKKLGAIDVEVRHPADTAAGASVVIIATPILQIRQVMEDLAPGLGKGALVTDTASTKRDVLAWADELLPDDANFVGGHPIAGKEIAGIDAAEASLFEGRPWAVSPSLGASVPAIQTLEHLIRLVGARPVTIDAAEHDSYLAAVSHLPLVTATALFSLVSGSHAWPELAALAGSGFRDTTRLASTNPDLSHDISLTNREALVHWLDRLGAELQRIRQLIQDEEHPDEMLAAFAEAKTARDAFLDELPRKPGPDQGETKTAGEHMMTLMVGEYLVKRTKELDEIMKARAAHDEDRPRGAGKGR